MNVATRTQPQVLQDNLDYWAEVKAEETAIDFEGRSYSWAELKTRVLRLAGALQEAGVVRGSRVATFDANHLALIEVTLAAARLGAATVIANHRISAEQLEYLLQDSAPRILFYGAEFQGTVELSGAAASVARLVSIDGSADQYEPFLISGAGLSTDQAAAPDDTCLIVYTSGTTGRPKGVELTHRSIIAHSTATNTVFHMDSDGVNLVAMPFFHVGGSCYYQAGMQVGARSILLRKPSGEALVQAALDGATHAFLVPAVLHGLLGAGEQVVKIVSGFKRLVFGAAPMPLPILEKVLAAWPGVDFVHAYGMTELSGVCVMLAPDVLRHPERPELLKSAGKPRPGIELRIVDPFTLTDVEPNEQGEIWVRAPQNMKGYLHRPEANAETITPDGYLRTGDVGRLDAEGYVYIVDRLKDMIITGGENVYSPEVENVLNAHPEVLEGVVIGVPDPKWGETVKAFVVPTPGIAPSAEDIIAFCRARLAGFQTPTSVEFLEELPRNVTGKILKRDLRQPHWSNHDRVI